MFFCGKFIAAKFAELSGDVCSVIDSENYFHVNSLMYPGEDIGEIGEGYYPGDYLKPVGILLAAEYGDRYVGAPDIPVPGDTQAHSFAQSLMMLDIAAIPYMYGANFNHNSGNTVYTFSTTTGDPTGTRL